MGALPHLCLRLLNRPENVLIVRQALSGVADGLGLDAIERNDLNTAATEACNNVVSHAYAGERGPLEVEVHVLDGALAVTVRDHGVGMHGRDLELEPSAARDEPGHVNAGGGIGLPVIQALARSAEFSDVPGGGTQVCMEIATPKAATLAPLGATSSLREEAEISSAEQPADDLDQLAATIELRVAPHELARAVLPRLLRALASRADLSTDRIADLQPIVDELVQGVDESPESTHLELAVTVAPRQLELRAGQRRLRLLGDH